MSFEEKRSWVYLGVTAAVYATYVAVILRRARDTPLTEAPYAWLMLGFIGVAVVANVVGGILAATTAPREAGKQDERDAGIHRYGEVLGYYAFSVGVLGALIMTIGEIAHFWIGNAIYLSFVLAALIGTSVKLVAYRRGLPSW